MGDLFRKIKALILGEGDDYEDEDEDDSFYDDDESDGRRRSGVSRKDISDEDSDDDDDDDSQGVKKFGLFGKGSSKVTNIGQHGKNSAGVRVITIKPRSIDEEAVIADYLAEGRIVILDLANVGMAEAQRILDFSNGVVYALHGNVKSVRALIYVLAPESAELMGDYLTMDEDSNIGS